MSERKRALRAMNEHLVGRRVRLLHTSDEYTRLQPGALGTVSFVDDLGTLHVRWDDGSSLGLVAEAGDRWEEASEPGLCYHREHCGVRAGDKCSARPRKPRERSDG